MSEVKTSLGGKKKLSLVDATAQSVGLMGPVFSIAFLVPLLVGLNATGNGAGNAAALSVLIATVGVLGLGWIVAEYTRKIQSAGSLYDYVTDGLGAKVGTASGWLYYSGILALGAGILTMLGGVIHDTIQGEWNIVPFTYLEWDLILFCVVGVIVYMGVQISTRVQLILALVSVTVVLAFSIFVIAKSGGLHHITTGFSPASSPTHWKGVMFGVLYGVLLFTGFETSANLGEETENPARNIPRAILIAVLAVAGFYIIGAFAQVAGFGFNLANLTKAAAGPLFALAGPHSAGGWGSVTMRRLVEIVVALDMFAVLLGCTVATTRGFFSLARDSRMPASMKKISKRGTPSGALVWVLAAFAVVIVLVQWSHVASLPQTPEYVAMFSWLSTYGGFAITMIYLMISIGAINGLKSSDKKVKLYLAIVAGIAVTVAAIYGAIYKVSSPTVVAPYAALAIFGFLLWVMWMEDRPHSGHANFKGLSEADQEPQKL